MNRRFPLFFPLLCVCGLTAFAAKPPKLAKIGVVSIQDQKGYSLGYSALNGRLLRLFKNAGFEAVALRFQPAADLEHTAREAGCAYILYTDIVDVHRTAGSRVANAVSPSHKRDIWDAEVEFRIYAIDQVQPLLATSVTGRNAKSHPAQNPTAAAIMPVSASSADSSASRSVSIAESNVLTDATPVEEAGRQRKHKSVAVASALEHEVRLVRERITHPPAAEPAP